MSFPPPYEMLSLANAALREVRGQRPVADGQAQGVGRAAARIAGVAQRGAVGSGAVGAGLVLRQRDAAGLHLGGQRHDVDRDRFVIAGVGEVVVDRIDVERDRIDAAEAGRGGVSEAVGRQVVAELVDGDGVLGGERDVARPVGRGIDDHPGRRVGEVQRDGAVGGGEVGRVVGGRAAAEGRFVVVDRERRLRGAAGVADEDDRVRVVLDRVGEVRQGVEDDRGHDLAALQFLQVEAAAEPVHPPRQGERPGRRQRQAGQGGDGWGPLHELTRNDGRPEIRRTPEIRRRRRTGLGSWRKHRAAARPARSLTIGRPPPRS